MSHSAVALILFLNITVLLSKIKDAGARHYAGFCTCHMTGEDDAGSVLCKMDQWRHSDTTVSYQSFIDSNADEWNIVSRHRGGESPKRIHQVVVSSNDQCPSERCELSITVARSVFPTLGAFCRNGTTTSSCFGSLTVILSV